MGLVFERYSAPFCLIDGYISTGQFCKFIENFIDTVNEDKLFDVWLHKVYDETPFDEYKNKHLPRQATGDADDDFEKIISDNMEIMKNFNPN